MSSLRLIYIKRIAYTVTGLSSIQVYTENEGREKGIYIAPPGPFAFAIIGSNKVYTKVLTANRHISRNNSR